ncbi:MAG: 3' terminal RNA ribose 2'-O-methyltransferase Hen1 [Planctomycetes bacterium]|nr:3' terminal RNA ribose 2'-O-methyltransferase Hen1 [Planctomycetota bacterium]
MLLEIEARFPSATDLGFLLHKNPARLQSFELSFGRAQVFYPVAEAERCRVALLLEVDPIGLVRDRRGPAGRGFQLEAYVNDRPYVASSFLSVAIAEVFGTALNGRCKSHPELVERKLAFEAHLPTLPCRGGEALLRRLFEPLGYAIDARRLPLDPRFPSFGESTCYEVVLRAELRLRELLQHLYVLVPVLDDEKHYWVGEAEVEKLFAKGGDWLATHPERELISRRFLRHQRRLTRDALARLAGEEELDPDAVAQERDDEERALERPIALDELRRRAVLAYLDSHEVRAVVDLGCGEGKLLHALAPRRSLARICGVDVSPSALERAAVRLRLEELPEKERARFSLWHGSLVYRDARLQGFELATALEVIEHLDPPRLEAFARCVLEHARPQALFLTTPNREHNALFAGLRAGAFRHRDHRFEWTRAELRTWAEAMAARFGYAVSFAGIGVDDPVHGPPTQVALFERRS